MIIVIKLYDSYNDIKVVRFIEDFRNVSCDFVFSISNIIVLIFNILLD